MKIGILTFHSQLNYGGVLQCWALQTALENLGHEVVVVDRWLSQENSHLKGEYHTWSIFQWIKFLIRGFLGLGDFRAFRRHKKTIDFIKKNLKLTPYHFVNWKDAPKDLGLDALVVGSDQVWHCGDWGDPSVYLLEGTEKINLPQVISYAASFGLKVLPAEFEPMFKEGLGRFKAISCREREGVEICRCLGYEAAHVIDPTLLLERNQWCKLMSVADVVKCNKKPRLVCYFMSVDIKEVLPSLIEFSQRMKCQVGVLLNYGALLAMPHSAKDITGNVQFAKINILRSCEPLSFVKEFYNATWVLTDSFHAVMFSSIFGCNARFIRPSSSMRAVMFARIEEFASTCVKGDFFVNDIKDGLKSFEAGQKISFKQPQIEQLRSNSLDWLKEALSDNSKFSSHRSVV